MTYQQTVMTRAHELYQANGGGSRDLFAACLSVSHRLVKEERARIYAFSSIAAMRRRRVVARADRMAIAA